jgi:NitT/TauT family transport system substrate-binding protein
MKLRIGHLSTFYHTAMLLMARRDLEQRLGIEVDWRLHGTGPALVQAFEKNEIDIAYIGLPPAIIGIDRGVPILCVAGGHVEGTIISGGSQLTGSSGTGDLQKVLGQYRGQTIGVPGNGSIHDVILTELLDRGDLREAVTVRHFAWADQITEAAVKGHIAGAVGTPALGTALRRYAGFKLLCPAAHIWPNNPSYGIAAGKGFLQRERAVMLEFLGIHEEATAFLRGNAEEAAGIISRFVGFIDAGFVLETLQTSPKYCADLTGEYMQATMDFVSCLKRLGYIKRDIAGDEIFDVSLIRAVHPGPAHYEADPARIS